MRFAREAPAEWLDAAAIGMLDQLFALYEPDSLLGFRAHEMHGRRTDSPALLDGATGIAMVLLAAATNIEPTWDRLFLLS